MINWFRLYKLFLLFLVFSEGYISSYAQLQSVSFSSPSDTIRKWTVPAGVSSIDVDVQGAAGAYYYNFNTNNIYGQPGLGGRLQATLAVTPGQVLYCFLGGKGSESSGNIAAGGWNGGGAGRNDVTGCAGGGGGASDIRLGDTLLIHRIIVAGGGGGSACGFHNVSADLSGGDGGGFIALFGHSIVPGEEGGPGTATAGGSRGITPGLDTGKAGTLGRGGDGGHNPTLVDTVAGGGGGGGYYGGGGASGGGGGGGSSYASSTIASAVTHTPGYNNSGGIVTIYYSWPAAIEAVSKAIQSARIYPNPSISNANLELVLNNNNTGCDIVIADMLGKTVWQYNEQLNSKFNNIPLPTIALPAGIYIVHITLETSVDIQVLRWVKE